MLVTWRCKLAELKRDRRGLAMMEFAVALPPLLLFFAYGIELSNYAVTQLRVSQLALALADNASRVGLSTLAKQQLREVDLNDVLGASRLGGERVNLPKYGRVTLSSLEADDKGIQRIHWQRCLGLKTGETYASHYGTTPIEAGSDSGAAYAGTVVDGMGPSDSLVKAPNEAAVMFVEINYQYQSLFGDWLIGKPDMRYTASFIVRDRRDLSQIFNPEPKVATADKLTCNRFTS